MTALLRTSSHNTLYFSNRAYLCPCHNFYLPSPCIPGSKRNQEESGDGGEVASVEEWIGNAQESCANTEIHQKEKPKKNVHRFWSLDQSFLRPGPLPRHHSCWFMLKVAFLLQHLAARWSCPQNIHCVMFLCLAACGWAKYVVLWQWVGTTQRRRRHFKSGQATANKRSVVYVHGRGGYA